MEDKNPEYLYYVYKITRQDREDSEYVAEGPGTRSSTYEVFEPINTNLDDLAPCQNCVKGAFILSSR